MRTILIAVALGALLVFAIYFASESFLHLGHGSMPPFLWLALGGAVAFSLLIGCGLMALMFYSSRHGYDDDAGHSQDGTTKEDTAKQDGTAGNDTNKNDANKNNTP